MTPATKTAAILVVAGAVAAGALLLTRAQSPGPGEPAAGAGIAAAGAAGLRLEAHLESSHVLSGTSEVHAAITIDATRSDQDGPRPDLDVAIVLDRSGSMRGAPMEQARAAARQLVSRFSPDDHFSVVVFGGDVDVIVGRTAASPEAVRNAHHAIDAVYAAGGTNLSGGLVAGRDEITRREAGRFSRPPEPRSETTGVARIVLISDGRANQGIVSPARLSALARETAERGVSITALGVGLDFDEAVMTSLAVNGRGNYYYAESAAMLGDLFDHEFERLGATVATGALLTLETEPGVEILEAYGHDLERAGDLTRIRVADLHAGESRKVVLRLRVSAPDAGSVDLARVRLDFTEPRSESRHALDVALGAEATGEAMIVRAGLNRAAVPHVQRALTAQAIDEATALYERGQVGQALELLGARERSAGALARAAGDEALEREVKAVSGDARKFLERAPEPASAEGRRGLKESRARSYQLKF